MKSLISPVQRRPPVLPGPTPREDDATSTAPVSGRTAATTESRVVREARNYADPDILEPRWLRVSDTPFDAPYKATKGYGRQMHPTTVSYDAPDGFQISPDRGTHYDEEPQEASPSRLPHQLSPDRGGVSLTAPEFFQPTEHPPLKETRYHKVQYDGRVFLDGITELSPGDLVKAQVTAAPEKGKANQALVKMLAKEWGIAKSDIEVVQGQTARTKTLLIRGDGAALAKAMTNWCKTKGWSFND